LRQNQKGPVKNAQVQGLRNPEEWGVLCRTSQRWRM